MSATNVISVADRNRFAFDRALGPVQKYLSRPGVFNVHCNPDSRIFIEERGRGKYEAPETMTEVEREGLIGICANETKTGPISRLSSRLAFDLPHGYDARGQAFCGPVGPGWPVTFRNHATEVIPWSTYDIDDDDEGEIDNGISLIRASNVHEAVREAIRAGWNIMLAGRPGSGKSTLMSSLAAEIDIARPTARVIVAQDQDEVKIPSRDHVKLFARVPQKKFEHDGSSVVYTYEFCDLLVDILRMSGDITLFSELRDSLSAVAMLMSANTGTRGTMTTIHSNGILDTLYRFEELVETAPHVTFGQTPRRMIARTVNLIAYMKYDETTRTRRVGAVRAVRGIKDGEYVLDRVVA
jgi:Flp pilus assembly CpaF family ATPase